MGLNVVSLVGRLVADPQERKADKYTIANFSIAIDREFSKDRVTDFLDCQAWGKTAEFVNQYLKKGSLIAVSGRIQKDVWKDKETGQNRSRVIIIADKVNSLGGGEKKDVAKDENLDGGQIDLSLVPF